MFDQSARLAAMLSPAGLVLEVNKTLLDMARASRQEVVGRLLWEASWWDDRAEARERLREAVDRAAGGIAVWFQLKAHDSSSAGPGLVLDVIVRPVRDESSGISSLVFEGQVVGGSEGDGRELAAALRSQQDLLETIPAVVFSLDLEGRLAWWNRKMEEVTGWSADELLHRPVETICPPEDLEAVREALRIALTCGVGEVESLLLCRDGAAIIYHWTWAPLHDESGHVVGLAVVGRDITRRIEVEAMLREQTEVVEAIQRVGQVLAAELDLSKLLQTVTDTAVELTWAGFGAFFYNTVDDDGQPTVRFTVAGMPPEVVRRLPMPHDSVLFGPAFRGEAVIRIDDVRSDPRSMLTAQQSLPSGHPMVASYLAVPVVSRNGEVLGGLLLGDERPGVFSERHERAAVGLAAQAATALDNARLYRAARQEIAERRRAEDALRESQERLLAALTASGTGTFRWDFRTGLIQGDDEVARLLDRPRSASGRPMSEALEFVHPDDQHAIQLATERCVREGNDLDLEFRVCHLDGTVRWIAEKGKVYRDLAGKPLYLTGACSDITDRKLAEQALRESERRFRLLVEHAADAFFLHDAEGRLLDVNQRACDSLGYPHEELLELGLAGVETEVPIERLMTRLRRLVPGGTTTFEGVHRRRDGTTFPVEVRTVAVPSSDRPQYISLARDISERKRAAAQLEYQASHDVLTGLPNRAHLLQRTSEAVSDARVADQSVALLLLDLDRFKEVNDSCGHYFGDMILRQLNPRFCGAVRETDLVARLGGDEFAVLLPATDHQQAVQIADRVLARLATPIEVEGQSFEVGASIGIALFPDHGQDASALLQHADVAMYAAKKARTGYEVYSAGRDEASTRRLTLITELRQAIEEGQLRLYHQPKIDLATGRVSGTEALVRWDHPRDGLIPPAEFIPLAEQTGLIRPLCLWVLGTALRHCAGWHAAGFKIGVAVNLAADNLQDPCLCPSLAALLTDLHLPPWCLTVEITESTMMADPFRSRAIIGWLHEACVRVAIDDFGTGYSSLAYLKDLPVDEVKIDRMFVKDMTHDRQAACITRAVIDLGHNLGQCVVAEGIEDQATQDLLASYGCDMAQGYHFCRPIAADDFLAWMSRTPGRATAPVGPEGRRLRG